MKVYTYKVTEEAELDAKEVFEWYENKVQGLGNRFLSHLERALTKLHSILLLLQIQVF